MDKTTETLLSTLERINNKYYGNPYEFLEYLKNELKNRNINKDEFHSILTIIELFRRSWKLWRAFDRIVSKQNEFHDDLVIFVYNNEHFVFNRFELFPNHIIFFIADYKLIILKSFDITTLMATGFSKITKIILSDSDLRNHAEILGISDSED